MPFAVAEPEAQPPRWAWFELSAAALILPWFVPRERRDADWRRRVALDGAFALTYLYFLALAGTTYAQGTRVMYPAQFAGTLLVVSAFVSAHALLRGARAASPSEGAFSSVRGTPA